MPKSIKVAIIEDEAAVRGSLEAILKRAPGCDCIGTFPNGEEAVKSLPKLQPDVVLMDINLPGMDGVECVRQLALALPETFFLMLTVHEDPDSIFNSLAAGASGYLLKPVRAAELLVAVKDVFAGGAPMTSNIARKVVKSFKKDSPSASESESLSPRETEVLDHLVKGYSYKEVAEAIGISYSTVHTHIERIYKKLHVRSRSQAVARYLKV